MLQWVWNPLVTLDNNLPFHYLFMFALCINHSPSNTFHHKQHTVCTPSSNKKREEDIFFPWSFGLLRVTAVGYNICPIMQSLTENNKIWDCSKYNLHLSRHCRDVLSVAALWLSNEWNIDTPMTRTWQIWNETSSRKNNKQCNVNLRFLMLIIMFSFNFPLVDRPHMTHYAPPPFKAFKELSR